MFHWHGNTIAYKGSAVWLVSDLMKCSASMKASLSQLNMFCFREKAKDKYEYQQNDKSTQEIIKVYNCICLSHHYFILPE